MVAHDERSRLTRTLSCPHLQSWRERQAVAKTVLQGYNPVTALTQASCGHREWARS